MSIPRGNPWGGEDPTVPADPTTYVARYVRGTTYWCEIHADPAGDKFVSGATCSFGDKVVVTDVEVDLVDNWLMKMKIKAELDATTGVNVGSISVTNPDGTKAELANCFSIE